MVCVLKSAFYHMFKQGFDGVLVEKCILSHELYSFHNRNTSHIYLRNRLGPTLAAMLMDYVAK